MVTARAGSAMAATLGNMRVTEQIDALQTMAIDPVHYLVAPRLLAALLTAPLLAAIFIGIGIAAAWGFGVAVLGLDGATFLGTMRDAVEGSDLSGGLLKSLAFAAVMAWIACYRGFFAAGGAQGVGRATARAVVDVSAMVLLGDYVLTAFVY